MASAETTFPAIQAGLSRQARRTHMAALRADGYVLEGSGGILALDVAMWLMFACGQVW